MIKNIVFDLGNVILKDFPANVIEQFNVDEDTKKIIKEKFFTNWEVLDLGEKSILKFYEDSNLELDDAIKDRLVNFYKYREFNEDIINLMNRLKNSGFNIYVLSNNNKETYNYLLSLPLFNLVDGWVISCDYHVLKPDKKIYEILFDKYNLKSEECFFVDDMNDNILMGKSLGMNGHVFDYENNDIDKLIKDLERYIIF